VKKSADTRYHPAICHSVDGGETWVRDTTNVLAYDNPKMLTYDKNSVYTLDAGKTWVKDPTLLLGPGGFNKDRDGKIIYYEPTRDWIMIWHLSQNNNREKTAFGLYRSKDFKKWELFQTIPGLWECPDMFEMPVIDKDGKSTGQKYWIISRGGVEYFIGTFDGKAFIPMTANDPDKPYGFIRFEDPAYDKKRSLRRVTFKSGCYAAQTFANAPDGRHIQVSWLSGDRNRVANPGGPWENMLSFPVELTLRDTGRGLILEHVPVKEIEKVYARTHQFGDVVLKEGLMRQIMSPQSNLLDIDVIFDAADAQVFGLEIWAEKSVTTPGRKDYTHSALITKKRNNTWMTIRPCRWRMEKSTCVFLWTNRPSKSASTMAFIARRRLSIRKRTPPDSLFLAKEERLKLKVLPFMKSNASSPSRHRPE
jgi:sucrose-6-phosphate hydrolase SacC (GH32 family)